MPIIPNTSVSDIVTLTARASEAVLQDPLSKSKFTLDSSGVAGFFGGESAVRAMATVNLIPDRRWGGWYNAPGSYEVAKQYGPLAMSNLFDGLFPGGERNPAKILMIDGQVGPKLIPAHSPLNSYDRIGHLGYLIARKAQGTPVTRPFQGRRHTMDAYVTVIKANYMPGEFEPVKLTASSSTMFAFIPMLVSVGACVLCALVADWFCLASIALGIIANGTACFVIGSGKLMLKHNIPAQAQNPGDVVLKGDTDMVVLIGNAGAVSSLTRGRFVLQYTGQPDPDLQPEFRSDAEPASVKGPETAEDRKCVACGRTLSLACKVCDLSRARANRRGLWISLRRLVSVRTCVLLLLAQFLAQLLLIPQGTLLGQLMFISTLIPSWMYHSYLSSLSLDFQTRALFRKLRLEDEDIHKYQLETWTEAVIFACLVVASVRVRQDCDSSRTATGDDGSESSRDSQSTRDLNNLGSFLDGLIPHKTEVWVAWKWAVAKKISNQYNDLLVRDSKFEFTEDDWKDAKVTIANGDRKQLEMYFADAENALRAWKSVHDTDEMMKLRG